MNSIASLEQVGIKIVIDSLAPEAKERTVRHGFLGRIIVAPLLLFGAAMTTVNAFSSEVAHADHPCNIGEHDVIDSMWVPVLDANGNQTYDASGNPKYNQVSICADGGGSSSGGSSGSGSGGNSNSGGSGGASGGSTVTVAKPKAPANPTFEQVLDFSCPAPDPGSPELAAQLEALKGTDGSERMVQVAGRCALKFVNNDASFGRPHTNIEDILAIKYLSITPNSAQSDAFNSFALEAWQALQTPVTVAEETTIPSAETVTTDPTSTSSVLDTKPVNTDVTVSTSNVSSANTTSTASIETDPSTTTATVAESIDTNTVPSTDKQEVVPAVDGGPSSGESSDDSGPGVMFYGGIGAAILTGFGIVAFARHGKNAGHGPTPQPTA